MQSYKGENVKPDTTRRSPSEQILEDFGLVLSQKIFTEIFGSIAGIGAVINSNREIVYVNENFIRTLKIDNIESILGKRPGEAISCVHAGNITGGCGTSIACSFCGALNAIMESQRTGQKSSREALITTQTNGKYKSLDLNIISSPLKLSGQTFYALIFQDISHEKRREALERIFFHDLLNSAGALNGMLSLIKEGVTPDREEHMLNLSEEASREIVDEIQMHRHLLAAENGDLKVNIKMVRSLDMIRNAINRIGFHESFRQKDIVIDGETKDLNFETDKVIFQRVLINLLKNALEATSPGGQVMVGVDDLGNKIRFWVRNDQVIAANIQTRLFQRSFSTKGSGRGLGTYSVRMLSENYLNGIVSFTSKENEGTIFEIVLNKIFT